MSGTEGKVVLVTGAARGMGLATAALFAERGARVVMLDIDERVSEAGERLTQDGHDVSWVCGDVSRRADVAQAVAHCTERYDGLDIAIAQAGIGRLEPLLTIDDAEWQHVLDVNLTGVFLTVQESGRVMASRKGGAIVVTASTNAHFVEASTTHYSASKGAVVTFVRAAALDLAPHGIRINCISPGIIRTPLAAFLTEDPVAGPAYVSRIPLGRFGEAHEVAATAAFLASDEAAYITGENIVVDGGATLGVALEVPDGVVPGAEQADQAAR